MIWWNHNLKYKWVISKILHNPKDIQLNNHKQLNNLDTQEVKVTELQININNIEIRWLIIKYNNL